MSDYQRWLKWAIRTARRQGWEVSRNGHVKFKSPEGQVVCASSSPRNGGQVRFNVERDLKRAGLELS